MQPTDYSAGIRAQRGDLTDYVVHLTKQRFDPPVSALQVLIEILETGYIRPTFAPYKGRRSTGGGSRPAVKGPYPTVCLTEQPISAILKTLKFAAGRYSGYGIAYYKPTLCDQGGRPVLYGSEHEIGLKVKQSAPGGKRTRRTMKAGFLRSCSTSG